MRLFFMPALAVAVASMLVFAVAAGADPASRPFKGSVSGAVTFVNDTNCPALFPDGPTLRTNWAATGTASHLGKISMSGTHCSGVVFAGDMTLVAANGDKVFAHYESVGPPVFPPAEVGVVYDVPSEFDVTGGTGRFENAVGSGQLPAHITNMGLGVPVWPVTWDVLGTIGY